jgi:uncharacterized protein (TIGR03067 family)
VVERVAELANSFLKSQALTRWIKVAGLLALTGSLVIALLFVTLGRKAQPVLGPKAQTDPDLLQGTWNATSVRAPRGPLPGDGIDIVFAGDRVTLRFPGIPPLSPTFRVDPSKDPKEIDLVVGPGVTWRGIYRLEGDRLQLCVDTEARERPASLSGERFFCYELQRVPAVRR